MPELPEVEAARALIEANCCGRKIVDVIANEQGGGPRDGLFDELVCAGVSSAEELRAALVGRTLTASKRVGKQMYWELSGSGSGSGLSLLAHFGMSGAFSIHTEAAGAASAAVYKRVKVDLSAWPPKFSKLELVFEGGIRLAFTDPRRLGRIKLLTGDPLTQPPLSELGPDALTSFPDVPSLAAALASRSAPVKALLLDQSWVAGIGNYLADEILYTARIHPESITNALTPADVAALHAAAKDVIGLAVSVNADSEKFPKHWLFHIRWGKGKGTVPKTVDGHSVAFITVGGRTSAVVTAVQGAPKKRAVAVAAAPVAASAATAASGGSAASSASGQRKLRKAAAASVVDGGGADGGSASAAGAAATGGAMSSPASAAAAPTGVSGAKRKRGAAPAAAAAALAPPDEVTVAAVAAPSAVASPAGAPAAKRRRGTPAAAAPVPAANSTATRGAGRRR